MTSAPEVEKELTNCIGNMGQNFDEVLNGNLTVQQTDKPGFRMICFPDLDFHPSIEAAKSLEDLKIKAKAANEEALACVSDGVLDEALSSLTNVIGKKKETAMNNLSEASKKNADAKCVINFTKEITQKNYSIDAITFTEDREEPSILTHVQIHSQRVKGLEQAAKGTILRLPARDLSEFCDEKTRMEVMADIEALFQEIKKMEQAKFEVDHSKTSDKSLSFYSSPDFKNPSIVYEVTPSKKKKNLEIRPYGMNRFMILDEKISSITVAKTAGIPDFSVLVSSDNQTELSDDEFYQKIEEHIFGHFGSYCNELDAKKLKEKRRELEALRPEVESRYESIFKTKASGMITMGKDDKDYFQLSQEITKKCMSNSKPSESFLGMFKGSFPDAECVNKFWKENYNITNPSSLVMINSNLNSSNFYRELRASKGVKENQIWDMSYGAGGMPNEGKVKDLPKGCRYDEEIMCSVCPDSVVDQEREKMKGQYGLR